eukprot:TRINITY_DN20408_c0_g1_i1.p1 TRINITY_DN20408_c0_g1~~TRINITY_DN20408_c0_g1_i1.p1  ORF type:complete len:326 (+),score=84.76 TRINITY_DN20408_c0_g1_i1:89-979(+)
MCGFDDYGLCDPDLSLAATVVAGSAAGMSEHLVMFPIDTIKTRIMSQNVGHKYGGMVNTGKSIISLEGWQALYKGFAPAFSAAVPAHAALFTTYERVKTAARSSGLNGQTSCILAAVSATMVHDSVTVPFDVVKNRMQEGGYANRTAREMFTRILREDGFAAFARPLPMHWLMNIPHMTVQWLTYESLKLATGRDIEEQIALDFFVCGALAGINASFISTPLDLIRTRIQLGGRSYIGTVSDIYTKRGVRGFWRGAVPRMTFSAPSTALTMTTYEVLKAFIKSFEAQPSMQTLDDK